MNTTYTVLTCIEASLPRRAIFERLAKAANLEFRAFSGEKEAIASLESMPSSAILVVGEQMEDGDPLQVIEHCRSSPFHASAPIAFVMNQRDIGMARNAMDAGATEVFIFSESDELGDFIREYAHAAILPTYTGKALLVEDDPIHAEYVTDLCNSLGFEVICVDEAEEAIEVLKRNHFHLLITDVVLRGTKTGIALIRQIRHELGLEIPIIVMSGFDDLPRRLLALRNGIGDFITKPFAPEEFIWRIQRVLQLVALSEQSQPDDASTAGHAPLRGSEFQMLSPREQEICRAVLKGMSDKEIATELGISYWTVRSHVQQIFAKTGAINRRELMARQIAQN